MLRVRPPTGTPIRFYSVNAEKASLKLVAELRELTDVSITKAREALAASNNDVSVAFEMTLRSPAQKRQPKSRTA